VSKLYPWLSILMALALAVFEWAFFFQAANWEGPSAPFAPERLGFDLAWLTLVYLSFHSPRSRGERPFRRSVGRDGVRGSTRGFTCCDLRKAGTPGHAAAVGAAFLLLLVAAIDLFGGFMFNIALSRRTMDVAGPAI